MKKSVLLIILVLLILAGCPRPQGTERFPREFRVGSEGLRMTVPPNLPPPRIFDDPGTQLQVVVELDNQGAADVGGPGDRIYLSGFEPNIITGIPTTGQQIPQLEGKTQFGPGGIDVVTFESNLRSLAALGIDKYEPNLLITGCYGYETVASASVCIDPDPFAVTAQEKVCIPRSVSTGTQGAPIAVSTVEVDPAPSITRFRIDVTNVGRGDVFKEGATFLAKCSPYSAQKLDFDDIDHIRLTDVSVSGQSILPSCRPLSNGYIRLINGRATIFCEFGNIKQPTAFTTPLTVRLQYGYRESQLRPITILSSGR